jgi:hypothetical protein
MEDRMLSDLRIRLRALVRGDAVEHELDDEMRFHIEHLRDKYVASGLSPEDAARKARLEFGGVEQVKEECREARGVALVETIAQDIRYGLRTLRRTPAFSITAVLTVALSTAAIATVFTLWHTLFYRALPVDHAENLVVVAATRRDVSRVGEVSYPDYVAFRDQTRTLDGLAAHYSSAPLFVAANGNAREINGAVVSANFLPLLGVAPALGRFFTPDEDVVPERARVVILGHSLWRSWFGSSPDVIGTHVSINGVAFTIVGVAPPTFQGVTTSPVDLLLLSRAFVGVIQVLFYAMDEEGHPQLYDFSLTPEVVIAGLLASLAVGCAFSLIPAWKLARVRRAAHLHHRAPTANWTSGRWLLGVQAAVAVALVAVAAVLAASASLVVAGANFESSHVALMRLRPRLIKYTPERAQRFQRAVIERLATVPGVESASMVGQGLVLTGGQVGVTLPAWGADQKLRALYNEIGPRYFETLRTPVLSGREFDDRDSTQSPRVAIVSRTLASRLWADRNAIGQTVLLKGAPHEVVGVVADVPLYSRTEGLQPFVYVPFWQNPAQVDSRLCIRVAGDPAAMLARLAQEVNRVDQDVPIAEILTLPVQMAGMTRPLRISATFVAYAAAFAMLLTAIGLYGALAFAVSRRKREIGIRLALGAEARTVLLMILRQGMTVIAAGVAAGLIVAAAGTRLFSHVLYGAASADWPFYALSAAVVATVGALASWLPARRAARVEPTVALRCE